MVQFNIIADLISNLSY